MTCPQGQATNHGEHRLSYQPALDGIRALAVGAVLAYHAGLPWARGGFLGVDAFFVLSGYLISSLLLLQWRARGSLGLSNFWARRARRLLPALFLMLSGVAVYALVFAGPEEMGKIRGDALATIAYVANWRPLFSGQSYFDQFSVPSPLRHTWSLAIEEQWYAVWPLLLLVLLRLCRGSLRWLLVAAVAMIAGSAFLMGWVYEPGHDPSRVYYGTDTRAQSLLMGAALAILLVRRGPLRSRLAGNTLQVAAVACAAGLGWVWARGSSDSAFLYRGGFVVLAAAVAVVITASVQPKAGPIGRLLSLPPLRWVGLISYGVYLWHWPVYLVLTPDRTGWDGYWLFAARVSLTLAIAWASYRFVEMPVRRGALRQWPASWMVAPATAAALAVALVLVTRGGAPLFSPLASASNAVPAVARLSQVESATSVRGPVRVMLLGDSVALTMGQGLERVGPASGLSVSNLAGLGCGFVPGDKELDPHAKWSAEKAETCKEWRSTWAGAIDAIRPDVVVFFFGPWDLFDLMVEGRQLQVGTAEWRAYASKELSRSFDVLSEHGATVVLLTAPCNRPARLGLGAEEYSYLFDPQRVVELNDVYREFAQQHADQTVIVDLNRFVCPDGEFTDLRLDGVRLRYDGVHFTPDGADLVGRWLAPQIIAAAAQRSGTDAGATAGAGE